MISPQGTDRNGNSQRRIVVTEIWDKEHAVLETRDLAAEAGFNKTGQALIATAVSELATNILRYAGRGELHLKILREKGRTGMEIVAADEGPGIADTMLAMQDHYSSQKGSLGLGLPSVKRIMDEFEITSHPGQGTHIRARKWRGDGKS